MKCRKREVFVFVEKNIKENVKKTKEHFFSSKILGKFFSNQNLNYLYRNQYCYVKEVGIVMPLISYT